MVPFFENAFELRIILTTAIPGVNDVYQPGFVPIVTVAGQAGQI
jgi:hypothetical protein